MFAIECRTRRTASRGKPHDVTINPDWSVRTPHDLEAERIAAAFGGFTSCLDLVDRVVPAVRSALGVLLRRTPSPVRRTRDHSGPVGERVRWHVATARSCRCSAGTFPDAGAAAGHLRSIAHLTRQYDVQRRQLTEVLAAVETVWGPFDAVPPRAETVRRLVREPLGVEQLWEAGLHPDDIAALATCATGVTEPLPASYYLGAAYAGVDLDWLRRTVASNPDPSIAAWLAWLTPEAGASLDAVGAWLELGLSRRQVLALVERTVPAQAALDLAAQTGRTPRAAARDLAMWAEARTLPSVEHFRLLDEHGLGSDYRPSGPAIDRVCEIAARLGAEVPRTDLGVVLAIAGSVPEVERLLARGLRAATDLVAS
ncbi:hypothetical protein D0Z08_19460 [Nocardioides immobilis]|uniref:Uncharacterized protein n=1 Tax=Nocardioides immobilis TaxID=2049295 RepID=A0A417XYG5_9ACTN|nr:hypothetical protein [Nocardioides immobilis]RHW25407.1 hypothetical protein D0Z08_19460 [Nocardioides immobilis]